MKRKTSPYIVALPAILLILLFKVFPVFYNLIIAFFKYSPKLGVGGSEAVGFANFIDFFGSYYFWRLLRNTFILTVVPIVFTCLVSFIASICLVKLPSKWVKCLVLSILAVPAFVPVPVLCGAIKGLLSSDSYIANLLLNAGVIREKTNLLALPSMYPLVYSVTEMLRYMFYPIALSVLSASSEGYRSIIGILRVIGAYALIRLAFFFVMDREITLSLYNPMVYETADTIFSFTYRKGLLEANYGYSAAVDTIQIILQLVFNLFLVIGIKKLLFNDDMIFEIPAKRNFRLSALISAAGIILVCAGSLGIVYYFISGAATSPALFSEVMSNQSVVAGMQNSLIYSIGSAILFTLVSIFLAYPLTTRSKSYTVSLFLLMIVNGTIAEWLLHRAFGLIDSGIAVILSGGISVTGALILHLFTWRHTREAKSFGEFIKITAPAAVLILALSFILAWGSTNAMTYLQTRTKYPISLMLRELLVQNDVTRLLANTADEEKAQAMKLAAGIIGSLPPLIVGWILIWFSKWFFRKKPANLESDPNSNAAHEVQEQKL